MVAVTPRMGSVSSCSGDGSASGEMSTRAAAQRIVATVACTSDTDDGVWLAYELTVEVENELRKRCGRHSGIDRWSLLLLLGTEPAERGCGEDEEGGW